MTGKPAQCAGKASKPKGKASTRKGAKALTGAHAGAVAASGPNAADLIEAQDRGGTVSLSLTVSDPAEIALDFLQTLIVPEGPLAGQPLKLAEYQKQFVRGSLAPDVMVGVLSIGRGNAKTALAAGLGLGSVMGIWDDQPKREIILAARNRDQAKTAFQFVVGFV